MRFAPRVLTVRTGAFGIGVALLAAAGAVSWARWPHSIDKGTIPTAVTANSTVRPPTTAGTTTTLPGRIDRVQMHPISLQIPSLKVNAPVVTVSVDQGGALSVPADPHQVGWWATGPPPGAPQGTAVIDGHVDSAAIGPGALFRLRDLAIGAEITVQETGGPVRFKVAAMREYSKASLPWQQIFDQSAGSRLVVVTCGGAFNYSTRHYADNVVVYAVPAMG